MVFNIVLNIFTWPLLRRHNEYMGLGIQQAEIEPTSFALEMQCTTTVLQLPPPPKLLYKFLYTFTYNLCMVQLEWEFRKNGKSRLLIVGPSQILCHLTHCQHDRFSSCVFNLTSFRPKSR